MKNLGMWLGIGGFIIIGIAWHTGFDYFEPVADVYLTIDENAMAEHSFDLARGYHVRGGELTARVTQMRDLGRVNGVHHAELVIEVGFDIDNSYQGWGWSRFDRPILYGWVQGAHGAGEGMHRHVESEGDIVFLNILAPRSRPASTGAPRRTRYAPALDGSCSTDYQHDLCGFRATLPITGTTEYVRIHLRERFR